VNKLSENEQLERARERVIDAIAQNINLYGVTESVGRLYGSLYFHDNPMTLDEMKDELGMSKTSMSTSVRGLMELKMVEKVWKKGERKDLYQAEMDWYQTFSDLFTIKWRTGVTANINVIEKSKKEISEIVAHGDVDELTKHEAETMIEKLDYALEYYDWLQRLVDSFESKEIFKYIPKKQDTD
jgi:DNA-binding transcriptional regulator GbsR (MarR family)